MQELEQAAYEVEVYENHIEVIQSVHKECGNPVDWASIANTPEPQKPVKLTKNEKKAKTNLETYKPNFIDKLFRKEEKRKEQLIEKIAKATNNDDAEYKKN